MMDYLDTAHCLISQEERRRLVRFCGALCGQREVAEDLAQETLLEAWRHLGGLRNPERRLQWLFGIARNVCLRWARKRGHDLAHTVAFIRASQTEEVNPEESPEEAFADDFDVAVELERKELLTLLDRALDALPAQTRIALIRHYVDESPLAEIAAQLGTNASAVAMRLHRGKLILRRMLAEDLRDALSGHELSLSRPSAWEATRLWCTTCGQHHLLGKRDAQEGYFELWCPGCCPESGVVYSRNHFPALLRGVTGYRRALSKLASWSRSYYRDGIRAGIAPCISCATPMPVRHVRPGEVRAFYYKGEYERLYTSDQRHGIAFSCPACNTCCVSLSDTIAQWMRESQSFLRSHPRVRTLPERAVEVAGRAALVTVFESVTDRAQLAVVSALDTYETLRIDGGER
ncbi:MAG TPA: RNA polymerase sigma factor [Ktedonobacterales bacterium]